MATGNGNWRLSRGLGKPDNVLLLLTTVIVPTIGVVAGGLPFVWAIVCVFVVGLLVYLTTLFQRAEEQRVSSGVAPPISPAATGPAVPAAPAITQPQPWSLVLAFAFGVLAFLWPVAALPGVVFSVLAIRGGRGAQVALGVFAFLWVLIGGVFGLALNLNQGTERGVETEGSNNGGSFQEVGFGDTAVLSGYFMHLQNRCASGIGPDPSVCEAALDPAGREQILQAFDWYACRRTGNDPRVCVTILP